MAASQTGSWGQAAELGSAWGLNLLYWIYRVFGRWPFKLALLPVVLYFFLFKAAQRRASLDYLRHIHAQGGLKRAPGAFDSLRHFFSFAEAILDKLIAFNGGYSLADVELTGRDEVERHFARGQGLIFVSAHLGNLEVCRALSREQPDLRLQILVHTKHAENFNRLIRRMDPKAHVNLHQVSEMGVGEAAWLADRLSAGESLVIAGDRSSISGARVARASFLGEEADFAQGPWVLAALLGCPVFLIFCVKRAGRYHISYEPFADRVLLPRKNREEAVAELAGRYAQRLEALALEDPYQWFNFFPFWRNHEQRKQ